MENLFNYLENIYNSNEEYKEEYEFEDFVTWFIETTFGFTGSKREGFIHDEFVCEFIPDIKIDFETKTIEILVEE